jgi:hypothetical protein
MVPVPGLTRPGRRIEDRAVSGRAVASLAVLVGLLVGPRCSSSGGSTNAGAPSIRIHGQVLSIVSPADASFRCSDAIGRRVRLTFRDASGRVLGAATTSPAVIDPTPPLNEGLGSVTCSYLSSYAVVLPRTSSYSVSSHDVRAGPVSVSELADRGFVWDLTFATTG